MNKYWIECLEDNQMKGILSDLYDAIEQCDDHKKLETLNSSLALGFSNKIKKKIREIREKNG
tara:strand:+ start:873 stop:1058 length:186 start_codon:yes stop_codon:yes gene_type:complete